MALKALRTEGLFVEFDMLSDAKDGSSVSVVPFVKSFSRVKNLALSFSLT